MGVFTDNGASLVIQRANEVPLRTFYPIRFNAKGEALPLWRSYLFIQFVESVTIELCRTTSKFVKVISARDDDGISRPVLVRKEAIDESLRLITQGRFDERPIRRRFYGKGSLVRVMDGSFAEKKVRLEEDIRPEMKGSRAVAISIGGWSGRVEIFKLAL